MMKKIVFDNFKLFNTEQCFEIKPMTILIGKNSSGKSALAKLPTLISQSLNGEKEEPFTWINGDVSLGNSITDINYGKESTGEFNFKVYNSVGEFLEVTVLFGKGNLFFSLWNLNDEFKLEYDLLSKKYFVNNDRTKLYDCVFSGFVLKEIVDYPESIVNIEKFKFDFDYICSYRIQPGSISEDIPIEKTIKKIGVDGKHAYEILINEKISGDEHLLKNISDWYKKTFDGWGINIDVDIQRNKYYFELIREIPTRFTTELDGVGQGISQILPLITKSFLKEEKPSLTIIEEPELHLHPSAHGDLVERFVESLNDENKRYVIETHSENFILRLRRLIAEKKFDYFSEKDIKIYYVEYDGELNQSNLREVGVSSDGGVRNWPRKVFSESMDELIAIKNAQM